jgi:hypothetical protein
MGVYFLYSEYSSVNTHYTHMFEREYGFNKQWTTEYNHMKPSNLQEL